MREREWAARLGYGLAALYMVGTIVVAGQIGLPEIDRLTAEAEQLWVQGRAEEALQALERAVNRIRELGERGREWQLMDRMGRIYLELDQFKSALKSFQQALQVALDQGDRSAQVVQLVAIGEVFGLLQEYQSAITTYEALLSLEVERQDYHGQWRAYYGLGFAHKASDNPIEAIPYMEHALALARTLQDPTLELAALQELAADMTGMGDYGKLARYSEEIMRLARQNGNHKLAAEQLGTLGYAHEQMGNFMRAATQYQATLQAYRELKDTSGEWQALIDLGRVALKQQQSKQAVSYFHDALRSAQRAGSDKRQVVALEQTGEAYRRAKDYSQAIRYLQQAFKLAKEKRLREYERIMLGDIGGVYEEMGNR
ncbi:MAG: tetratricopeptide repeat protein [Candidatus Entotheonellia bacterium]